MFRWYGLKVSCPLNSLPLPSRRCFGVVAMSGSPCPTPVGMYVWVSDLNLQSFVEVVLKTA